MGGAMWKRFCLALALIASSGAAARAQPEHAPALPLDSVVANPDWAARPTAEDMARYYPAMAGFFAISGLSVVQCSVSATGSVQNCRSLIERPAGLGFGQAAVAMSSLFRMKPQMVDGRAVSGATVKIPISFRIASDAATPTGAALSAPPTPRALELARRLATARQDATLYEAALQQVSNQLKAVAGGTRDAATKTAAQSLGEELDRAALARKADYLGEAAASYAGRFSEAELAQLVAFYETPVGGRWAREEPPADARFIGASVNAAAQAAGRAFCRRVGCEPASSAEEAADRSGPGTGAALPLDR